MVIHKRLHKPREKESTWTDGQDKQSIQAAQLHFLMSDSGPVCHGFLKVFVNKKKTNRTLTLQIARR